ncbi:MAG: 23S rRNA (uracil(1939)-C(5))-methyltransferase RlmD [Silvanigrellaceae bacterium]
MSTEKKGLRRAPTSTSNRPGRPSNLRPPAKELDAPIPRGVRSGVTRRMMLNREGEPQKVFHETVCKVLDQCQSCPMLDMDYRDQVTFKTTDFKKRLAQAGLKSQAPVSACLESPNRLGYRNTAKLAISEKLSPPDRRFISVGLYKPGTHHVIDVGDCPIQNQRLNKIISFLRTAIRDQNMSIYNERSHQGLLRYIVVRTAHRSKDTLVTFVVSTDDKVKLRPFARNLMQKFDFISGVLMHVNNTSGNAIFQATNDPDVSDNADATLAGQTTLLAGQDCLRDSIANLNLRISASSFFQVNPTVAEQAYFRMIELLEPKTGEKALDLYCGVGSLALLMSRAGARVTAIEETPSSIADAHENALTNSLQDIDFRAGRAEVVLPELMNKGSMPRADIISVNPSRRGCQPEVLKAMADLKPRAIAYMSCNPETLLRDLRQLEQLGLQAKVFELYDMFPGSRHYEVVTLLTPA